MKPNQLLKTTQQEGSEDSTTKQSNQQNHAWLYLGLVGNIGYTISVPIAGGTIIGSMIDRTWSTYPKATLVCLFLGIVISIIGFIGIIKKILEKKI